MRLGRIVAIETSKQKLILRKNIDNSVNQNIIDKFDNSNTMLSSRVQGGVFNIHEDPLQSSR